LIPQPTSGRVQELAQFEVNYVFCLNLVVIAMTIALIWLNRGSKAQDH
jgi:hypothetical protein